MDEQRIPREQWTPARWQVVALVVLLLLFLAGLYVAMSATVSTGFTHDPS